MTESEKNMFDTNSMVDSWMRAMSDVWTGMAKSPFQPFEPQKKKQEEKSEAVGESPRFNKYVESGVKAAEAFTSAMSRPETLASIFKGVGSLPDMFLKMVQPVFDNISVMYQQLLGQIEKTGRISEPFSFDRMDRESLNIFTKQYDAEFKKFFNIPQLGLTREHQEKINRFMDRFNLLSAAMAEFLQVIFQPFEKSYLSFQEKIADLSKKNELPGDPKHYYPMWLKILEGEYMMLFKTPGYLVSLAKTIHAVADYNQARRELSNDLLHQLSIPSPTDVDGVYKDLYLLKKRIRNLEKAMAKE